MTDFGGKTSIFSHPVYLFLRKFSLQDSRGGSQWRQQFPIEAMCQVFGVSRSGYYNWVQHEPSD
ncbi:hypothetical protein CBL27_27365, partial [Shigella sonnei]